MTTKRALDEAFDAVLCGRPAPEEMAAVAAFTAEVRDTALAPGRPNVALAELLVMGRLTENGDPSARAASNATGPADKQASGLPKWRRRIMLIPSAIAAALAKFAAAGTAAHAAAGVTIALASVGGAGAAGVLPAPAQDRVAAVVEAVTALDLPDSADAPSGKPTPAGATEGTDETTEVSDQPAEPVAPPTAADFGTSVSTDAQDGGVDGAATSDAARDAHQPVDAGAPESTPAPIAENSDAGTDRAPAPAPAAKPAPAPAAKPAPAPAAKPAPAPAPTSAPAAKPAPAPVPAPAEGSGSAPAPGTGRP